MKIPDDVVERARVVYNEAFVRCNDPLRAALRVFVEWEREQCAKVADDFSQTVLMQSVSEKSSEERKAYSDGYWEAAEEVAAAIRARSEGDH